MAANVCTDSRRRMSTALQKIIDNFKSSIQTVCLAIIDRSIILASYVVRISDQELS